PINEPGGFATPAPWGFNTSTFNATPESNALISGSNVPSQPDSVHHWPDETFFFMPNSFPSTPATIARLGSVDSADCSWVRGWACSELSFFRPIAVQVYKNGPAL